MPYLPMLRGLPLDPRDYTHIGYPRPSMRLRSVVYRLADLNTGPGSLLRVEMNVLHLDTFLPRQKDAISAFRFPGSVARSRHRGWCRYVSTARYQLPSTFLLSFPHATVENSHEPEVKGVEGNTITQRHRDATTERNLLPIL
jgi:hypothetical protein